jgi:signal transduction histidine kinase
MISKWVWTGIYALLLILTALSIWGDRDKAGHIEPIPLIEWIERLDQQALRMVENPALASEDPSAFLIPQVVYKSGVPVVWTQPIPIIQDLSKMAVPLSEKLAQLDVSVYSCFSGQRWLALTSGELDTSSWSDDSESWVGIVPIELVRDFQFDKEMEATGSMMNPCPSYVDSIQSTLFSRIWPAGLLFLVLCFPGLFLLFYQPKGLASASSFILGTGVFLIGLPYLGLSYFPWLQKVFTVGLGTTQESGLPLPDGVAILAFFLIYVGLVYSRFPMSVSLGSLIDRKIWLRILIHYLFINTALIVALRLMYLIVQPGFIDITWVHSARDIKTGLLGLLVWLPGIAGTVMICGKSYRQIQALGAPFVRRLWVMLISIGVTLPLLWVLSLGISWIGLVLYLMTILLFLDIFSEEEKPSLSWILAAIFIVSAVTTVVSFSQMMANEKKWATEYLDSVGELIDAGTQGWTTGSSGLDLKFGNIYHLLVGEDDEIGTVNRGEAGIFHEKERSLGEWKQEAKVFKHESIAGRYIVRPKISLILPLSYFSIIFSGLIIFFTILTLLNYLIPILPDRYRLALIARHSLRTRIQLGILATILLSFIIIGVITQYYTDQKEKANEVTKSVERTQTTERIRTFAGLNELDRNRRVTDQVEDLFGVGAKRYFKDSNQHNHPLIPFEIWERWQTGSIGEEVIWRGSDKAYFGIGSGEELWQVNWGRQVSFNKMAPSLMGSLLSVYVFLFLLAGSIGLAIANSITWPVETLAEKIKQVRLGKQNQPLQWKNPDELGDLINVYNDMISQLDNSAKSMVKLERDMAWREMAQQVAHEIKNPLTPMKLSIQYMQQAVQRDPERLEELVKRVSETLLEQVENLSAIATTFSNFGTLPKANNQKINLNEVAASVHDLFRKREDIEINLYVPIEDIWVFGDRNFMLRVLNNLIKNAIQAIPADRQGIIDIRLVKTKEIAQIVIKDNGIGIPDSMKDNVFEPNFTTKTSGTGLGLAICASLLESFNGTIYFETVPNEGTTFFVELPLMRFEDNFSHIPRVSLDD